MLRAHEQPCDDHGTLTGKLNLERVPYGCRRAKKWRESCNAALDAKDPNELMRTLQELKKALKHEEQVLHDFWEAVRAANSPATVERAAASVDVSPIEN